MRLSAARSPRGPPRGSHALRPHLGTHQRLRLPRVLRFYPMVGSRAGSPACVSGQAVRWTPTSLARSPAPPLRLRRGSAVREEGPQEAGPPSSLRLSREGWAAEYSPGFCASFSPRGDAAPEK